MVRSNDMSCISKYRGSRKSCGSYVLPSKINWRTVGPHQYKFDGSVKGNRYYLRIFVFTFVPCSILILSKFITLKFTLKQLRHKSNCKVYAYIVKHNYVLGGMLFTIRNAQLHVSATNVGHHQVVQ
jgi:hypothetical protein